MDFTLTEEQSLFRDSVARFLAEQYRFDQRQKIIAEAEGFREQHWQNFAELGWLAASFPEDYGGLGGSPFETLVLVEQFGRGLLVSPYFSTVVLGGQLVVRAGSESQKQSLLPAIAEGTLKLALAHSEPQSRYDLADVTTRAVPEGGGYRIDGRKSVVLYATAADKVIVSARTSGQQRDETGISLFLVDADNPGLTAHPYRTHDGGRASDLQFDGLRVDAEAVLGPLDQGFYVLTQIEEHAIAALCAEASGAMWAIHEQTLDYLKTRKQFGQTLGSFQALQHRSVDVFMKCQLAQSLAYEATGALLVEDDVTRARAISAAKYQIGRYATEVGQEGIQLHGAMGMMTELPIGHYYKRLTLINATFGNPDHHLARYRALLQDQLAGVRDDGAEASYAGGGRPA